MAIKKVYELSVDMKRTSVRVNVPVLVQGDSAEFRIRLADNGVALSTEELGGITSVTMQSGFDAQTIIETIGTLEESVAVFRLQKGELFRSGTVQAMVQLADADDRISTLRFEYQVIPELSGNYIPGEQDITVFQRYMNDAQAKIDEMAATDVAQLTVKLAETGENVNRRVDELVIESGNANAEVTDAHVSTVKSKTFSTIRNRFEEAEKHINQAIYPVQNKIKNGNFSNSHNDWLTGGATKSVANNVFSITGTGAYVSVLARQTMVGLAKPQHKVALNYNFRVTNSDCTKIRIYASKSGGTSQDFLNINNPVANQWYSDTKIIEIPDNFASGDFDVIFENTYADATTSLGKVGEIKFITMIDLTETFGVNSEPAVEDVKAFLAKYPNEYFDGVVSFSTFKELYKKVLEMENTSEAPIVSQQTYIPSEIRPDMNAVLISAIAPLDMRPIYVDSEGYIWGTRKISSLSLVRATKPDLSDAVVVNTLPGGAANVWRNIIRVAPGKLVAYVMSSDAAQRGFYVINDTNPANVTYTRVAAGFPAGDPDPVLQTVAKSDDGKYIWMCTYSAKNDANPVYYIYRSTDYGDTWEECYRHITNMNVHIHCLAWDAYRNRIWACIGDEYSGGRTGIAYSDQYGATGTWTFLEAEAGTPAHMHTSIVPLPDKVLFGTDRFPAGILEWKPTGENANFIHPVVLNSDFTQIMYAQSKEDVTNLGFAGRPAYDLTSYPYKIVMPFGNIQNYCDAWIWISPDAKNYYTVDHMDNPDTSTKWMRGCIGITKPDAEAPNGWVLGISTINGGDEYYFRFKFPDWYGV